MLCLCTFRVQRKELSRFQCPHSGHTEDRAGGTLSPRQNIQHLRIQGLSVNLHVGIEESFHRRRSSGAPCILLLLPFEQ